LLPVIENAFITQRLALAGNPSYKIVLKLTNILKDQKVFWRIKGLTIRNKSER
jgi:hypothetical protein